MKLTVNTSMRWIQQNLRYQAYMEGRGKEGNPASSSSLPKNQAESESTVANTDRTDIEGVGNTEVGR